MLGLRWLLRGGRGGPYGMPSEPLWLRAKGDGKKKGGGGGGAKGKEKKEAADAKPAADKKPAAALEEEEEVVVEKKKRIAEIPIFYKNGAFYTAQQAYAEKKAPLSDKRMKKFRQSFNPKRKRKGVDTLIQGVDAAAPATYPDWMYNAVALYGKKMRWQDMSVRDPKYWKLKRRSEIKAWNQSQNIEV